VYSIPLEDLLISKLWPTFEPNTVHDLLLLLSSDSIENLDNGYLSECFHKNDGLQELAAESLARFERIYQQRHGIAWLATEEERNGILTI